MTGPAKELTEHASSAKDAAGPYRDHVNTARAFLEAFVRLGYDRDELLRAAGVARLPQDNPDAYVPCQVIGGMCGYAMRARPLKNLGMKLAAETPVGAFPLLDYLIVTCETVGQGLRQLSRYLRLTEAPYTLEILDDEDPVRVIFHPTRGNCPLEFGVSLCVLHLREETEGRLGTAYVSLRNRPDDASEMERVLGCPVRGEAAWAGFALSQEAWRLPMRRPDPVLRGVLERHAAEIMSRLPAADGVVRELREALMSRIARGEIEIESVARSMAISARSLQRRLARAGTTYQELLEATRREAACRYLADRALSVGEVAYLLGYSEPAAFHRAFKRWNGTTPQEYRRERTGR
jgi:AraC-like DNA-binding protein